MKRSLRNLTPRARKIVDRAECESRDLGHSYIGTEHLLLAFVDDETSFVASVLRKLGVDHVRLRGEIVRLVTRGPASTSSAPLPLTPRALHSVDLAGDEACCVGLWQTDAEHLLLGLMREPDGVAGQVLRNLSLPFEKLRGELLRIRHQQMQIVERAVRPVRARTVRKRKMREELLAHLTAIFTEELDRLDDPEAALREAAHRFGDPSTLARELDAAQPRYERRGYYLERLVGWRAPETAAKWMSRAAIQMILLLVALCVIGLTAAAVVTGGVNAVRWNDVRGVIAFVVLFPVAMAALGFLYFKIRDSMYGVFGARKSPGTVLLLQLLWVALVTAGGVASAVFAEWNLDRAAQFALPYAIAGIVSALAAVVAARISGPSEIQDTIWECIDIRGAALES